MTQTAAEEKQQNEDQQIPQGKDPNTCPFMEFGCNFKGDRIEISKHVKKDPLGHLAMLCSGMSELKVSAGVLQMYLNKKNKIVDTIIPRVDFITKIYGVHLLWKIVDYQTKFNECKAGSKSVIFSQPFMTSRHGYKLAVSASLFGDGKARGKYMSVFVCICKGEFDDVLPWPFAYKINFTLLDQADKLDSRRNINYTVKPNPVKENRLFLGRPTGERNASFGAQKFAEIAAIENENFNYVKDDIMFVKVHVEMGDMPYL